MSVIAARSVFLERSTICCRTLLAIAGCTAMVPLHAGELGITSSQSLSFGKFAAGDGSVTVRPDGSRLTSGQVITLDSGPGQAASFVVTGDPDLTYAVTLPGDGTVTMSDGVNSMQVNSFVSSPVSSGTLSGGGSQLLDVGATLEVGAGQPAGNYSGTFMVVVDYN